MLTTGVPMEETSRATGSEMAVEMRPVLVAARATRNAVPWSTSKNFVPMLRHMSPTLGRPGSSVHKLTYSLTANLEQQQQRAAGTKSDKGHTSAFHSRWHRGGASRRASTGARLMAAYRTALGMPVI
eukprot:scaffold2129_cov318-Prasinococcus_capsulatus_cf.AAC.5